MLTLNSQDIAPDPEYNIMIIMITVILVLNTVHLENFTDICP